MSVNLPNYRGIPQLLLKPRSFYTVTRERLRLADRHVSGWCREWWSLARGCKGKLKHLAEQQVGKAWSGCLCRNSSTGNCESAPIYRWISRSPPRTGLLRAASESGVSRNFRGRDCI